jgi:hypothetical protein
MSVEDALGGALSLRQAGDMVDKASVKQSASGVVTPEVQPVLVDTGKPEAPQVQPELSGNTGAKAVADPEICWAEPGDGFAFKPWDDAPLVRPMEDALELDGSFVRAPDLGHRWEILGLLDGGFRPEVARLSEQVGEAWGL